MRRLPLLILSALLLASCGSESGRNGERTETDPAPVTTVPPTAEDSVRAALRGRGLGESIAIACRAVGEGHECDLTADSGSAKARVQTTGEVKLLGVLQTEELEQLARERVNPEVLGGQPLTLVGCERSGLVLLADGESFKCEFTIGGTRDLVAVVRGLYEAPDGWVIIDEDASTGLDQAVSEEASIRSTVTARGETGPVGDAAARRDAMLQLAQEHATLVLDDFGLTLAWKVAWPATGTVYGGPATAASVSLLTGVLDPRRPESPQNPLQAVFAVLDSQGRCAGGKVTLADGAVKTETVPTDAQRCSATALAR